MIKRPAGMRVYFNSRRTSDQEGNGGATPTGALHLIKKGGCN